MTSLIGIKIPLKLILMGAVLQVVSIRETPGYDASGNPTGEFVGYTILCYELKNFKPLKVKIPKVKLAITPEELAEKRENDERVFVEFDDAFIKPYYNSKTKTVEDSITASDFHVVAGDL